MMPRRKRNAMGYQANVRRLTIRFSVGLVGIAILVVITLPFSCKEGGKSDQQFGGVVSAATPEAAAA